MGIDWRETMGYISPRARRQRTVRRRAFRRISLLLLVVLIVGLMVWGGVRWSRSLLITKLAQTTVVNTGVLQATLPVEAMVLCNEALITSSIGGVFYPGVNEGQRVRKGEILGKMSSSVVTLPRTESYIVSPYTGLVCYHLDGWEGLLTEEKYFSFDWERLDQLDTGTRTHTGKWVEPGVTLARVVNNLTNTTLGIEVLTSELSPDQINEALKVGKVLSIRLSNAPEAVKLKIKAIQKDAERIRIIAEFADFREDLLHQRKVSGDLILQSWTGFVIPHQFLVYREEVPGLFILRKGWIEWKPVEVVGAMEKQMVVKGLKEGEVIVTNPRLVEEGIRLY